MKKEKLEKYERVLITTEGKEIKVEYELSQDEDDFVLEGLQETLNANGIFYSEYVDISLGEIIINQLDFKKIIGIRWN